MEGSSCECSSSSSGRPSSECRDVAAVPGDAHQQVCAAPSSRLGGYRDSGDDEAPLETATRQIASLAGSAGLQFGEDLGEESRLAVDSQHLGAQSVHDQEAPIPEFLLAVLDEERFQGIADLVSHVAVAQIEARQYRCLEFPLGRLVAVDQLSYQHINEYYVGRIDKGDVLPALNQQILVDRPQPHDRIASLEVS